jgi:hypothetical protein
MSETVVWLVLLAEAGVAVVLSAGAVRWVRRW